MTIQTFINFNANILLSPKLASKLGFKSILTEKFEYLFPYIEGKLLDIGCYDNELVRSYIQRGNEGIGVDVYKWDNVDIVCDTTNLPLNNDLYDTVTLISCLNHIVERKKVLLEARRVLKPKGKLIITMISRKIGFICHKLVSHWDWDRNIRKMEKGELNGMDDEEVKELLLETGFKNIKTKKFGYFNLNTMYQATK